MLRLRHLWQTATSGYWFVPSLMTLGGGVFAFVMLWLDRTYLGTGTSVGWLYSGGADGAKTLLSTVAGSTITVAGVVFSITIAALTQASAQFGPRLLRQFMRDTSNQIVLGTFVATFLFCLLILRTIHGKLDVGQAFVPQASVSFAVLLAIASIAVLIYFIHHVSMSLQAPNIVAAVRRSFEEVIDALDDDLEREDRPGAPSDDELAALCVGEPHVIIASRDGYIQAIDYGALVRRASAADLVLRVLHRPGDYAIQAATLIYAWPLDRASTISTDAYATAFIYGDQRTAEQDLEFAVKQIVEVGVRALSPGINDPFTALNCVDALGSTISRVARKGLPPAVRRDRVGAVRVITHVTTFAGLSDVAFSQLRQYARQSVAVTLHLLETLRICGEQLTSEDQRAALRRHAQMIYRQSQDPAAIPEPLDREEARRRWERAARALSASPEARRLDERHAYR